MDKYKEHWNNRCKKYGYDAVGVIGTKGGVQEEQYRKTIDFLMGKIPTDKKVLDYGCGVGKLSHLFKAALYIGVDISEEMLSIAKQKNPEYTYRLNTRLPKTDITFIANVLQHNPDDVVKKIRFKSPEMYIYELKEGGKDKEFLYHRSIKDYEKLLGKKCVKSWDNGSHRLMYLK